MKNNFPSKIGMVEDFNRKKYDTENYSVDFDSITSIIEKKLSTLEDIQKKLSNSPFTSNSSKNSTQHSKKEQREPEILRHSHKQKQKQRFQIEADEFASPLREQSYNIAQKGTNMTSSSIKPLSNKNTQPIESLLKEDPIDPSVSERYRAAMNQIKRERYQQQRKKKIDELKLEQKKASIAEVNRKAREVARKSIMLGKKSSQTKFQKKKNVKEHLRRKDQELISRRWRKMKDLQSATVQKMRKDKIEQLQMHEKKRREQEERLSKKKQMEEKQRKIRMNFKGSPANKTNVTSKDTSSSSSYLISNSSAQNIFHQDIMSDEEITTPKMEPQTCPSSKNGIPPLFLSPNAIERSLSFINDADNPRLNVNRHSSSNKSINTQRNLMLDIDLDNLNTSSEQLQKNSTLENNLAEEDDEFLKNDIRSAKNIPLPLKQTELQPPQPHNSFYENEMEKILDGNKSINLNNDNWQRVENEFEMELMTETEFSEDPNISHPEHTYESPLVLESEHDSVINVLEISIRPQLLADGMYAVKWSTKGKRLRRFYRYIFPFLSWAKDETSKTKNSKIISIRKGSDEASTEIQDNCITIVLESGRNLSLEFADIVEACYWFETIKNSLDV
eukprot:TRINITY_DN2622_c0_g1_i1.p1 TRINITY_DN2622_c0_g1~~TRINITY_DN2622_c0_g1_i1.p1  ORF type:complete len:641 (-),score=167.98 TRINITY_DN2622_c0_g1_i1:1501-3351(-)